MTPDTMGKTAIRRTKPSAPARWLVQNGLVPAGHWASNEVLDFGAGTGRDAAAFGWDAYDPAHRESYHGEHRVNDAPQHYQRWRYVVCTYVANVVMTGRDELALLSDLQWVVEKGGDVYISVRRDIPEEGTPTQRWVEFDEEDAKLIYEKRGAFAIYRLEDW